MKQKSTTKLFLFTITVLCGLQINAQMHSHKQKTIQPRKRWIAWSEKPAPKWEDAFVTGNGKTGTMAFGEPGKEIIRCVQEELFMRLYSRRKIPVPDVAHLLPRIRELASKDSLTAAANLINEEGAKQMKAMGLPRHWAVIPHPAFDLNIKGLTAGNIQNYKRSLNMETGESQIYWKDESGEVEYTIFSSRPDNVNVIRVKGKGSRALNVDLSLDETPGRTGVIHSFDVSKAFNSITNGATEDGFLTYKAQYANDPGGYEGVARVTVNKGTITRNGNQLQVKGADEILVVMRISPLEYGKTTNAAFVKTELSSLPVLYEQLLRPHANIHGEMFGRVVLDLNRAAEWTTIPTEKMLADADKQGATPLFLEQLHAMGRYLLISTSGKYPSPLQGIWSGGWTPTWVGGFVFDSNINLAISAVSTGDLKECAESYFKFIERLLPAWRLNAKNYLGTRGFIVSHYPDPETGFSDQIKATFPWIYWTAGAGWNLMPFYEHGMLYDDKEFLRQRVYPLYIEMSQLYEDYMTMGNDGYYHIIPGISPENGFKFAKTILSKDATMDIAVAKEVFDHLLKLGKMFNASESDMNKWQQYYDKILPYRINSDGALAEWIPANYPDYYQHRHNSHLYPVFPGTEFLQPDTDPALVKAARVALEKRFNTDTESAHGIVHILLMAARLGNTEKITANLNRFAQRGYVYNGLSTSHNSNHKIYNLDAILSLQRLLSEMVVFSQPGRITLLPACSSQFPDGKLSGLRVHGGHKVDISWESGQLKTFSIHASKKEKIVLVYDGKEKEVTLKAGAKNKFTQKLF